MEQKYLEIITSMKEDIEVLKRQIVELSEETGILSGEDIEDVPPIDMLFLERRVRTIVKEELEKAKPVDKPPAIKIPKAKKPARRKSAKRTDKG